MAPLWLSTLGWAAIAAAAVSAGWIGFDVVVRRRRQHMRIMEVVWPVTALYFGPLPTCQADVRRPPPRTIPRRARTEHLIDVTSYCSAGRSRPQWGRVRR